MAVVGAVGEAHGLSDAQATGLGGGSGIGSSSGGSTVIGVSSVREGAGQSTATAAVSATGLKWLVFDPLAPQDHVLVEQDVIVASTTVEEVYVYTVVDSATVLEEQQTVVAESAGADILTSPETAPLVLGGESPQQDYVEEPTPQIQVLLEQGEIVVSIPETDVYVRTESEVFAVSIVPGTSFAFSEGEDSLAYPEVKTMVAAA